MTTVLFLANDSWGSLIVVHGHVFVPIVGQDLPRQPFLLFIGQIEPVLLFEELFILLREADTHVVGVRLRVALWESKTVHDGLWRLQDSLHFVWPALLHLHVTLLKRLVETDSSHLLYGGLAFGVLNQSRLQLDFVDDALEGVGFVVGEVGEDFAIELNV